MRISVQDEKEFQSATGAVNAWAEVQYDGVEFEYADKEAQKQNAIAKACDNVGERKKIYEDKFGLKLTPTRFNEGEVAQRNAGPANYAYRRQSQPGCRRDGRLHRLIRCQPSRDRGIHFSFW